METTSCIIQDSERLKQDAIDKAHIESMSDNIKIPKIAFYNNNIYFQLLSEIISILARTKNISYCIKYIGITKSYMFVKMIS